MANLEGDISEMNLSYEPASDVEEEEEEEEQVVEPVVAQEVPLIQETPATPAPVARPTPAVPSPPFQSSASATTQEKATLPPGSTPVDGFQLVQVY